MLSATELRRLYKLSVPTFEKALKRGLLPPPSLVLGPKGRRWRRAAIVEHQRRLISAAVTA